MLTTAVVLFLLGAIGGITMAVIHFFQGRNPSWLLVGLHGIFVASGLIVLILALLAIGFGGMGGIALVLFLLAAVGGFWLLSTHLQDKRLSNPVVLAHGATAAIAFILLLVVWLRAGS